MTTLAWLLLAAAQDPIDLWPGRPPGDLEGIEDKIEGGKRVVSVGRPTIAVHRPSSETNTGTAIVVCPGGGYKVLAFEHEGTQVAEWLTSIGITAVLLKYRVPRRPGDDDAKLPLQDVQRALSLTRHRAREWGVDPSRIGVLGFSAGGHLAANASCNFDRRAYEPIDEADATGCRPDFAVLVYPGGVLDKQDPAKLSPLIRVSKETPPSFLVVSSDDKGSLPGTLRLYQGIREAGVPVELHVYAEGAHGYGMRKGERPHNAWPKRCEEWLRSRGLLK